ncbi:ROK family protein [Renibacterium salmoninarum]|nr:ROK family protein [Renibacterium salmoninarum]
MSSSETVSAALAWSVLCLDFGGTTIKVALARNGELLASTEIGAVREIAELTVVAKLADDLLRSVQLDRVAALGMALPGIVERNSGLLLSAAGKYDFAANFSLRDWAEQQFCAPVAIELDSRAALVGELEYGALRGEKDAALLVLGTGIGAAVMLDGVVLQGSSGHAGVLGGHLPVDARGEPCRCGSYGCAESAGSGWDLASWPHPAAPLDLISLLQLMDDGDLLAGRYWDRLVSAWALAAVGLIQSFDPAVLVVSGGMLRAADRILPALQEQIAPRLWPSLKMPEIRVAKQPEFSVLRGLNVLAELKIA